MPRGDVADAAAGESAIELGRVDAGNAEDVGDAVALEQRDQIFAETHFWLAPDALQTLARRAGSTREPGDETADARARFRKLRLAERIGDAHEAGGALAEGRGVEHRHALFAEELPGEVGGAEPGAAHVDEEEHAGGGALGDELRDLRQAP